MYCGICVGTYGADRQHVFIFEYHFSLYKKVYCLCQDYKQISPEYHSFRGAFDVRLIRYTKRNRLMLSSSKDTVHQINKDTTHRNTCFMEIVTYSLMTSAQPVYNFLFHKIKDNALLWYIFLFYIFQFESNPIVMTCTPKAVFIVNKNLLYMLR